MEKRYINHSIREKVMEDTYCQTQIMNNAYAKMSKMI